MVETVPEGGHGRGRRKVGGAILQVREAEAQEDPVFGCLVRGSWGAVPGDGGVLEIQLVSGGDEEDDVRYYALTDSLHVLKVIGSDCTAFGICCTAFLCDVYFEIRTSKALRWILTLVLPALRLRGATSTFVLVRTSSST